MSFIREKKIDVESRNGDINNPSEEKIKSHLKILNEAFSGRDREQHVIDPVFRSVVAGDINIRFVLAKRDPDGLPTSGILRAALEPTDSELNVFSLGLL